MGLLSKAELLEKYHEERNGCDVYTRVMGYMRPRWYWLRIEGEKPQRLSSYNVGKQSEFDERVFFKTQKPNPSITPKYKHAPCSCGCDRLG